MGFNWRQFELGVLRPTLEDMETGILTPEVGVKIVGETLWHESGGLSYLGQMTNYMLHHDAADIFGPGLGIASMERPTWDWLAEKYPTPWFSLAWRKYEELAWDLRLNVIACRLRYAANPSPLPDITSGLVTRATYWWTIYNGSKVDRRPDYMRNARGITWVR